MSELVYFMLWAGIIFLMIRFGCGAHEMGHSRGKTKHGEGHPVYFVILPQTDARPNPEAARPATLLRNAARHGARKLLNLVRL